MTPSAAARSAVLALTLLGAAPTSAQSVILPLDKGYPEDQFYFLTYNAASDLTLRSDAVAIEGKSARASWRIRVGKGGLGYVGFGYLHRTASRPVPDLSASTHLSLWYDNTRPIPDPGRVTFRFELHEDSVETDALGFRGSAVWVYETDAVLPTAPGWTELLIPLSVAEEVGPDGFAIPPGAFAGDGVLDLARIRHWAIVLVADGQPVGTVIEGATRFDALTAVAKPVAAGPDPQAFQTGLGAPYPNPLSHTAAVPFTLAEPAAVTLRVVDALGRVVASLVDGEPFGAGAHEVRLDGLDLAPGTYALVLDVGRDRWTRRLAVVR